jgi:hypothetical protein
VAAVVAAQELHRQLAAAAVAEQASGLVSAAAVAAQRLQTASTGPRSLEVQAVQGRREPALAGLVEALAWQAR